MHTQQTTSCDSRITLQQVVTEIPAPPPPDLSKRLTCPYPLDIGWSRLAWTMECGQNSLFHLPTEALQTIVLLYHHSSPSVLGSRVVQVEAPPSSRIPEWGRYRAANHQLACNVGKKFLSRVNWYFEDACYCSTIGLSWLVQDSFHEDKFWCWRHWVYILIPCDPWNQPSLPSQVSAILNEGSGVHFWNKSLVWEMDLYNHPGIGNVTILRLEGVVFFTKPWFKTNLFSKEDDFVWIYKQ